MGIARTVKRASLRLGGYTVAQATHARLERRRLLRRVEVCLRTGRAPLPDQVMLEPTQRCNLRCAMCYQDRARIAPAEELSAEDLRRFFEATPGLRKVTLIGGEVFVRRDLVRVVRSLREARRVILCTNGTLVGEAEIEGLRACRNLFTVCVSLDGPEEIHDAIRGVPGSFARVARAIPALAAWCPVTVNAVIQDANLEALPQTVDLCAALGARKLKLELERLFSEAGRAQVMRAAGVTEADLPIGSPGRGRSYAVGALREVLAECKRRGQAAGIYVVTDPPYMEAALEACWGDRVRQSTRCVGHCLRTATIAPDGEVIHCLAIRKPLGNIREAPLSAIWNAAAARELRRHLLDSNMTPLCENCPFMVPLAG